MYKGGTRAVPRREFLSIAALTLSGCSAGAGSGGSGNTTYTDTPESTADEFREALTSDGIEEPDTMGALGDVSLMYRYHRETEDRDINTIAITFSDHWTVADNLLSVTGHANGQRQIIYHIETAWAAEYWSGEISDDIYLDRVHETVEYFNRGDG